MAKALVCSAKSEQLQLKIVKKICGSLHSFFKFNNGVLIIKLIFQNFIIPTYSYFKNASKHTSCNPRDLEVIHNYSTKQLSALALEILSQSLFFEVNCWDLKPWKGVISFALKNCGIFANKLFHALISDACFIVKFMKLNSSLRSFASLIEQLTDFDQYLLMKVLKLNYQKLVMSCELESSVLGFFNSLECKIKIIPQVDTSKQFIQYQMVNRASFNSGNIQMMQYGNSIQNGYNAVRIPQFAQQSQHLVLVSQRKNLNYSAFLNISSNQKVK